MASDPTQTQPKVPAEDLEFARQLHSAVQTDSSRGAEALRTIPGPVEPIIDASSPTPKVASQSTTKTKNGESPKYKMLKAQSLGQISALTALCGSSHEICLKLNAQLIAANQKIVEGEASVAEALMEGLVAQSAAAVSTAQQAYAAQRVGEQELEKQRLALFRRRLILESDIRVLGVGIGELHQDVSDIGDKQLPDVVPHLTSAKSKHVALGSRMTESEALLAIETAVVSDNDRINAAAELDALQAAYLDASNHLKTAKREFANVLDKTAATGSQTEIHFKKYQLLLGQINDEFRLPPSSLIPFRSTLEAVRKLLIRASGSEPVDNALISQAKDKLDQVEREFDNAVTTHLAGLDPAVAAFKSAQSALVHLTALALPAETSAFAKRIDSIQSQIENREFTAATEAAAIIRSEIETRARELEPSKTAWEEKQVSVQLILDKQPEPLLELEPPHKSIDLSNEFLTLVTAVTGRSMSFLEGVIRIDALQAKIDENKGFSDAPPGLGETLEAWKVSVTEASERVTAAISTLKEACNAGAAVASKLVAPFEEQQQILAAEWEVIERSLTNSQQEAVANVINKFCVLETAIHAIATSSEILANKVREADRNDALAALAELQSGANEQIDTLRNFGLPEAEAYRKEYAELFRYAASNDAPEQIRNATERLASDHLPSLVRVVHDEQKKIDQLQANAKTAFDIAKSELTKFETAVNAHGSGLSGTFRRILHVNEKKEYKEYIAVLNPELTAFKPMIEAEFEDLLNEAIAGLNSLAEDIRNAFNGLNDILADDDSGAMVKTSLSNLKHRIEDEVERVSQDSNVKVRLPDTSKKHCEELTKLKDKLGQELLTDSEKAFAALKAAGNDLIDRAASIATDLQAFNSRAATLAGRLTSGAEAVRDFETVVAKLNAKIESARAASAKENGLDSATFMLDEVDAALARSQDAAQLANMVREIDRSKNGEAQAQVGWEAEETAFEREFYNPYLDAIKSEMSPTTRFIAFFQKPEKFKDIKNLRDMAHESAGKGDYDMARYQLSMARRRMEFHIKFPEGQNAAVLKDITAIKRHWRAAIETFRAAVDESITAITEEVRPDDAPAADAVTAHASELRTILSSNTFDAIADDIVSSTGEAARNNREAGLALVRQMRTVLEDPRVRVLSSHPFASAPAFKGHFAVGKALLDFEKTMLLTANN